MGFNLELMFVQLYAIINNPNLDEQDKLSALEEAIQEAKTYAIQCGQLKEI